MDGSSNVHSNRVLEHLLWNMDSSDHRSSEHLLFATHELFEEVDCDVIVWHEIHSDICREKVVYFTLAVVLG